MKLNKEECLRWLDQARHNLEVAEHNLKANFYSDACFLSEQAAQMALKAFIIFHKKRFIWEHSIQKLAEISGHYDSDFVKFVNYGKILDRYYILTRYPNALPSPAIPYKTYTEKDAKEALNLAKEIINLVNRKLEGKTI